MMHSLKNVTMASLLQVSTSNNLISTEPTWPPLQDLLATQFWGTYLPAMHV